MSIRAVLFDMDYTLLDREVGVTTYARKQFSRFVDGEQLEQMVEHFRDRDLKGFSHRSEVYTDVADAFGCDLPVDELVIEFENKAWDHVELYDGVVPLLKQLRAAGLKLGLITNGSEKVQNLKVNRVGLRQYIDVVAIAGELDLWKPDPAVFEHVCISLDVAPQECLFVGDTPAHDIIAAKEVGMTTIWRKANHRWPEDAPIAYDYAVDHVAEILDIPGLLSLRNAADL